MVKNFIDLRQITRETLEQLARIGLGESPSLSGRPTDGLAPQPVKPRAHRGSETGDPKGSPRPRSPRSAGVPLEEAPEDFFDRDEWNEFVAGCGSRRAALRQISRPKDAFFVPTLREFAEQPTDVGAKAREREKIAQLGQRLVANFLFRLVSGKLAATGMSPPSPERIGIPAELWQKLVPDFEAGTAEGSRYFFACICITEAADVASGEVELVKRIATWLTNLREQRGDQLKKTLLHEAREVFGEEFINRVFDTGYREIYRRKRGRPRRSPDG
jgi:hypothetical protein